MHCRLSFIKSSSVGILWSTTSFVPLLSTPPFLQGIPALGLSRQFSGGSAKTAETTRGAMTRKTRSATAAATAAKSITSVKPHKAKKSPVRKNKAKDTKKDVPRDDTTDNGAVLPWYHFFTKGDETYNEYMSTEWGFEKRGSAALFEKISLEGAQSGLSWRTILFKRDGYRRLFHNFDIERVAAMTQDDVDRLVLDPSIVRHRGKIESVIHNAKCIQEHIPDLDEFVWSFVQNKPILHHYRTLAEVPTQTPTSQALSKSFKEKGMKFVGPTTMYAFMQSVGMVVDHKVGTPEYEAALKRLKERPGGYQEEEQHEK
eukprot:Nitzschia sp. Nitz4//scaffold139_size61406//18089//19135//NITZ4_006452-RA/size61406-snap-gene-0.9-mRNA-1//-1//CDS//3329535828//2543//frame0